MDDNSKENFDFANWGLSKAWQFRFEFYKENGLPERKNASRFKEAFKALPMGKRFILANNIGSLFFGPLYFLCTGMWRKAIVLLFLLIFIDVFISAIGGKNSIIIFVNMFSSMVLANPAYYLHRVKKSKSFNIFEGVF